MSLIWDRQRLDDTALGQYTQTVSGEVVDAIACPDAITRAVREAFVRHYGVDPADVVVRHENYTPTLAHAFHALWRPGIRPVTMRGDVPRYARPLKLDGLHMRTLRVPGFGSAPLEAHLDGWEPILRQWVYRVG